MSENVTPFRNADGTYPKGVSGNPHGVSSKEQAFRELRDGNEEMFEALMAKNVPAALRLHKWLLKDGRNMTTKDAIHLLELTYKYGVGTPRQSPAKQTFDDVSADFTSYSPEKKAAMIAILQETEKDALKK